MTGSTSCSLLKANSFPLFLEVTDPRFESFYLFLRLGVFLCDELLKFGQLPIDRLQLSMGPSGKASLPADLLQDRWADFETP